MQHILLISRFVATDFFKELLIHFVLENDPRHLRDFPSLFFGTLIQTLECFFFESNGEFAGNIFFLHGGSLQKPTKAVKLF